MSVSRCPKCKAYHSISKDELRDHDRELKEALERWGILENEFDFWADNEFKEQWNKFWKEMGIE
jgi:hypothetical protein